MATGLLVAAFLAFLVANLIHNRFGVDPALLPAAVLLAAFAWRRRRGLLWAAALVIALPAFGFLRWGALADPGTGWPFLNHVALLLAGGLAVLAVAASLTPGGRRAPQP